LKFEAPRGTHDILPPDQPLWRRITGEMERLCTLYGYAPIQTPVFEDTELFARTSGAGSDVVQKEMYTFTDRSDRSLTLRADLTAPICRAYVEHGMHREPQPVKLYEIASVYRYAAPQRGRYREHWQLSVEAIGSDDPALDAEIMHLYHELLARLGLREWALQVNSIGDRNCRPAYVDRLNEWLDAHADVLDDDARQKRATTPLRVFDVKNPEVRAALDAAPKIGDALCDACREHFDEVKAYLDAYGIPYTLEPTLVRGLDYYTRTVWEFVGPEAGAQSTISAGGRYDYLIEEIGGPATPAVGIGAGVERLALACEQEGIGAEPASLAVFVAVADESVRTNALDFIAELRRAGIAADTEYAGRSLKGQLTQAQRSGAHTTIVWGAEKITLRRRGEKDVDVAREDLKRRVLA
jgi:histidyl-tRNA synthetase